MFGNCYSEGSLHGVILILGRHLETAHRHYEVLNLLMNQIINIAVMNIQNAWFGLVRMRYCIK